MPITSLPGANPYLFEHKIGVFVLGRALPLPKTQLPKTQLPKTQLPKTQLPKKAPTPPADMEQCRPVRLLPAKGAGVTWQMMLLVVRVAGVGWQMLLLVVRGAVPAIHRARESPFYAPLGHIGPRGGLDLSSPSALLKVNCLVMRYLRF